MQGRNVVVGNLVYSLVLGMSVPDVSGAAIANLEVETLQHKFPTFHGDTIHAETRVLDVQPSKSKPDRGIVTVESQGLQPGRPRGVLLPSPGDGVEARQRSSAPTAVRRHRRPGPSGVFHAARVDRNTPPRSCVGPAEAARSAVAAHPRSMGDPRQRGDAAADAGAAGDPEVARRSWPRIRRRRRVRRRRSATCCGCGRASATRGGPATCTLQPTQIVALRRISLDARGAACACPASATYTARAVLAFAFEADVAVVDTNIARVLARVAGHRLTAKQAQAAADAALPAGDSWAWNQCLMDLGAVLCRPVVPAMRCVPIARLGAPGAAAATIPRRFGWRQHDVRPDSTAVIGRPVAD